jgi:hypothetical protein
MRAAVEIGQTVDSGALLCYPSVTRTSLQDRSHVRVAAQRQWPRGHACTGATTGTIEAAAGVALSRGTDRSLEQHAGSGSG